MPKFDENIQEPIGNDELADKLFPLALNPTEIQREHARMCGVDIPYRSAHYYGHTLVTTLQPGEKTEFRASDLGPISEEHKLVFLKDVFPGVYSINVASVCGGAPGSTYKIQIDPRFTSIKDPEKRAQLKTSFTKFRKPGSDEVDEGTLFVQGGIGMTSDKQGDLKAQCNVYGSAIAFVNEAHMRFANIDLTDFKPKKSDEIVEVPTGSPLVNMLLGRVQQDPSAAELFKNAQNRPRNSDKVKIKGVAYNNYSYMLSQLLSEDLGAIGTEGDGLDIVVEKVNGPEAKDDDPPLTVTVDILLTHPDMN